MVEERGGVGGDRRNAFNAFRLLFAALVIVSHSAEMAYGDRSHELLTLAFGTLSFGELAVDGFFLISGYLITASYQADPATGAYLAKRCARLIPGFFVAWMICIVLIAPLSGGALPFGVLPEGWPQRLFLLLTSESPGTFPGSHWPQLNGAMWTISHEFRCYLLVLIFGISGVLRHPRIIGLLAALALVAVQIFPAERLEQVQRVAPNFHDWFGRPADALRLAGVFLAGSYWFLRGWRIHLSATGAIAAMIGLIVCLQIPALADLGIVTLGALLLFHASFAAPAWVRAINSRTDISYGLYLYAWPVEKLLWHWWPGLSVVVACLATLLLAAGCGYGSWVLIERPAIRAVRDRLRGQRPRLAMPSGTAAEAA